MAVLMFSGNSEEPSQATADDSAATSTSAESAAATVGPVGVTPSRLPLPAGEPVMVDIAGDPLAEEPEAAGIPESGEPPDPAEAPEIASDRARAFMKAWAQPELSAKKWRAGVAPFVDSVLAEGFAATDPTNVPATKVNGVEPLEVTERSIVYRVGTDAGDMRLVMTSDGITWWASELAPGRDLTAPTGTDEGANEGEQG